MQAEEGGFEHAVDGGGLIWWRANSRESSVDVIRGHD